MKPWTLIDSAPVPGDGGELQLHQRDDEFSIRLAGRGELMNSRVHGSEDALAQMTRARLGTSPDPRILIGGLGMGFTLAAALQHFNDQAQIEVAELIPAVIEWNRGPLGKHAGYPVKNSRVTVRTGDVANFIRAEKNTYDAILLDVDNGPEGLTRRENDRLYSIAGLGAAYQALRPRGILAVWSAGPAADFTEKLLKTGFDVEQKPVRAHGNKGSRHIIWFARRDE
jgi:spermidine synthase